MDMPWPLARDFAEVAALLSRKRMVAAAIAARVAAAEIDWKKWLEEVSR